MPQSDFQRDDQPSTSRRRFVGALSVAATLGAAGCTERVGDAVGETAAPTTQTKTSTRTPTESPTATPTPTPTPIEPKAFPSYDAVNVDDITGLEQIETLERAIHDRVNVVRSERDLYALGYRPLVAKIARLHSRDMAQNKYFAHENLEGQAPGERMSEYLRGRGILCEPIENILKYEVGSSASVEEVARKAVDAWMDSPPHRDAMLTEVAPETGVGAYLRADGMLYATQEFVVCSEYDWTTEEFEN